MTKQKTLVLLFLLSISYSFSQDDLLNELKNETKTDSSYELPAFKAVQIGNLQSTKIAGKGDFFFIVAHRFSPFSSGLDNFFGLDDANTKIQFVYSFWDGIQFSLSRDSYEKTYSGSTKLSIKKQSSTFPLNIVGYISTDIETQSKTSDFPTLEFKDRVSITAQILTSRRITKNLSLLIAPTFVRQNNLQQFIQTNDTNLNRFIVGVGGRLKISKRMSINADYGLNINRHEDSIYKDPFTIGFDIETGGHVFQLIFTNSRASNDSGFLTRTRGDWFNDVAFGFNIVRVF
ncbi:DUF5777 family beta-barrel protein [Tenacibaculum singaporense]|uniref:DUF5777 family beta-barrel protein n=1 Tax=Tenacibaculum singaporense TaxID=2358479 RepID=UPI000F67C19E|nr:DUF5777 family beta-barrel protein [Tenacibaculum singaporense]RSC95669.1 hypothetical protein EI424_00735 [Tenacibaculum singaporense]